MGKLDHNINKVTKLGDAIAISDLKLSLTHSPDSFTDRGNW